MGKNIQVMGGKSGQVSEEKKGRREWTVIEKKEIRKGMVGIPLIEKELGRPSMGMGGRGESRRSTEKSSEKMGCLSR